MLVLVVDDSRSVRIALRTTLEKKGYDVIEAANGKEAVELVSKHSPDLVTMDVQMPEMDGFESCRAIRQTEQGNKTPIVFVTSIDTLDDRKRGFDLGATEFISKNISSPWLEVARVTDRILRRDHLFNDFTVLIALDSGNDSMVVNCCLAPQGAHIIEAENGNRALELACSHADKIDLVICSFQLPDMQGDELTRALRQKIGLQRIPIIILCTQEERDKVIDIFRAGTTDYIVKPFVQEVFMARIFSHLELRRTIKELSRNVIELERLSKLRDEFVAVASHDLKSPLNGIMGYTQLLEMDETLSANNKKLLGTITTQANIMLDIVNDIVELSRNEAKIDYTEHKPMPVKFPIGIVISSMQQIAASKGVNLEMVNNFDGDPVIVGNNSQFSRILYNLISNAVKFTPKNGTVTIEIKKEGNDLILLVNDTGVGIPQEIQPNLFDRFTKASRRGTDGEPGTGLGMSITKQLIDQHAGHIDFISTEGMGTSFRLTFPLTPLDSVPTF